MRKGQGVVFSLSDSCSVAIRIEPAPPSCFSMVLQFCYSKVVAVCKINFCTYLQALFSLHREKSAAAQGKRAGKLKMCFSFCIHFCPSQGCSRVAFPSDLHRERFLSETWGWVYIIVIGGTNILKFPSELSSRRFLKIRQRFLSSVKGCTEELHMEISTFNHFSKYSFPNRCSHIISVAYWKWGIGSSQQLS